MNIFNDEDVVQFLKKDFVSFEAESLRKMHDNPSLLDMDVSRFSTGSHSPNAKP